MFLNYSQLSISWSDIGWSRGQLSSWFISWLPLMDFFFFFYSYIMPLILCQVIKKFLEPLAALHIFCPVNKESQT